MLAQLSTVKARLAIADIDTTSDALLTSAIKGVSARFDRECNRTFARTENATCEFEAAATEVAVACYPIEAVTKWECKTSESEGWLEQPAPLYVIRSSCVLSLRSPFILDPLPFSLVRLTYTGGYVLPGAPDPQPATPSAQPVRLPDDLEQAAVEQVAWWFQNRDRLGLTRIWEYHATYRQFADLDLLSGTRAVLSRYRRWNA